MGYLRGGILLGIGGLAGLLLAALLESNSGCSRDYDEDDEIDDMQQENTPSGADKKAFDRPSLEGLVKSVKADAEKALDACETDEEREAIYAQVAESIENIKETLGKKSEEVIAALREREDAKCSSQHKGTADVHAANIRNAAKEVSDAFDEIIASLKPQTAL